MPVHLLTQKLPANVLRVATLALLLVLTLTATACDAPDEENYVHRDDFGLRPTPTPVEVEVHRDDFGRRATSSPDRDVLVALYHATDGDNWTNNTNWLSDAPLASWHGVTTDDDGRVVKLEPWGNQLRGTIPPELGRLTKLEHLAFSENQLRGGIPPELGRLVNLELLMLNDNQLRGTIPPELANLSRLRILLIGGTNHLTGCIPEALGAAAVGDLAALRLPYCDANGSVPPRVGPAPAEATRAELAADRAALVALYRATDGPNWRNHDNWLSEAPLNEWHGVTTGETGRVVELRLPQNNLSGRIPPELGNLAQLELLALSSNRLTGWIPPELGNLARLVVLSLYGNQLGQTIPPELGNLAELRWLDLNKNRLQGTIPRELGRLSRLESLDLSTNQLTGRIPPELGNLADLEWLSLFTNQLSGQIPRAMGRLARLGNLALSYNQLSGPIPSELGGLARLQRLWLGGSNSFTGCIPEGLRSLWFSDLHSLGLPFCGAS